MTIDPPVFSELSADDINTLTSYGISRRYPKNSILINKGDDSNSLFIILEGRVKVYISDDMGGEIILRYQGANEFFGELALIDERPRSASVSTVDITRVAYLSQSSFERCLEDHSQISIKLVRYMIKRICVLTDDLADCALKNVYQRVKEKLTKLSTPYGSEYIIEQYLTHHDIAGLVGSGREMVSRIMKKLKTHGYIEIRNRQIVIVKTFPRNLPS